ncbi:MAG TPA: bifunctional 5,10-methylenetetrahydrofolate dehydrogenase/5,10-methenyltetrahydrofolate cyclohydrolase [Candidatus Paceibacterota bacterium]
MTIDGRAIADDIYTDLSTFFKEHHAKLGIVVVGDNPVIASFVRIKERSAARLGVEMVRRDLPESAFEDNVISTLTQLVATCDAVIPQLPMPGLDINKILTTIPREKDVDALNPTIREEERPVHAPVALAAVEILQRQRVPIHGARAVVVGEGRLVGAPSVWLLKSLGADVSIFSLDKGSIEDLKEADIIISGAGKPGLIKPEHLKQGVALIDAGTSELNKRVVGDVDPACAEVASIITPVPGGVGPVAVAMIFRNLKMLIRCQG